MNLILDHSPLDLLKGMHCRQEDTKDSLWKHGKESNWAYEFKER